MTAWGSRTHKEMSCPYLENQLGEGFPHLLMLLWIEIKYMFTFQNATISIIPTLFQTSEVLIFQLPSWCLKKSVGVEL